MPFTICPNLRETPWTSPDRPRDLVVLDGHGVMEVLRYSGVVRCARCRMNWSGITTASARLEWFFGPGDKELFARACTPECFGPELEEDLGDRPWARPRTRPRQPRPADERGQASWTRVSPWAPVHGHRWKKQTPARARRANSLTQASGAVLVVGRRLKPVPARIIVARRALKDLPGGQQRLCHARRVHSHRTVTRTYSCLGGS